MDDRPKYKRGEEMENLRSEDTDAMLTAEPAEGAGPGPETRSAIGGASGSDAAPGGLINTGAAGDDLPQNDMPHAASADRGDGAPQAGPGQGDDLADRLGGGEGRGAGMQGNSPQTGDLSASAADAIEGEPGEDRAAASAAVVRGGTGGDAGSPGGMGGVHSRPNGTGRPPGGVSPVQDPEDSAG